MSRFVQRDGLNRIVAHFANPQPGFAEEEVADDNAELVAFITTGLALTAEEVDAKKTADIERFYTSADKAIATALFQVVNDVRGLKGQAPISAAQFKAYLKSLL